MVEARSAARLSARAVRAATAFARVLREKYGIQKGDRVVLAMRNYPEWALTFWATLILGAVIVPLNAWGTGSLAQRHIESDQEDRKDSTPSPSVSSPDAQAIEAHLRESLVEKTIECAVLERNAPGSSKYRALKPEELNGLLPASLHPS